MRRSFFICLFFSLIAYTNYAQVDSVYTGRLPDSTSASKKKPRDNSWMEKFIWGGNFQAWIGNPTFVFISPTIGYVPFSNFNVGIGGIYNYTSFRSSYGNYSQSIFGG